MKRNETRYYSSLNSNIRLSPNLTSYAKLVCAELIAIADGIEVTESNEDIAELLSIPTAFLQESLDLLEAYNFITLAYSLEGRVIKLENIAL
jgi:hypothetical protein